MTFWDLAIVILMVINILLAALFLWLGAPQWGLFLAFAAGIGMMRVWGEI